MDKIRYGNGGGWIAQLGALFSSLVVITAQPGFLSISCGGITNHTAENNITWVPDADYIDVGQSGDTGNTSRYGSYLHTLRVFPKPLNKACYKLPVKPYVPYLVRLWFAVGNYNGFPTLPTFNYSIETVDMLYVGDGTATGTDAYYQQQTLVTSGTVMYICLIRTSELDDPFISAIELRTFQDGMYRQANPGTLLFSYAAYDVGGNSVVRYPQDKFDRLWMSDYVYLNDQSLDSIRPVSSQEAISTKNTKELPPTAAMQTAWVGNGSDTISFGLKTSYQGIKSLLLLYFAEIERLNMSESRSFYVEINGETLRSETITLFRNYSTVELTLEFDQIDHFNVVKAPNSTRLPILNAYEYHWVFNTDPATYSHDSKCLKKLLVMK